MIIAVAVAVLMFQTASAQQCFEHVLTVDRKYPNDGDCHDGILFQFHSQNHSPEGDYNGCSVIDMNTGRLIQFIDLGFNQNFHNSSITFAEKKYSRKDRFPLLYASENYAGNEYYKVIVYRVLETGRPDAPFALECVQTINMPDPHAAGILYPHCFYDREGGLSLDRGIFFRQEGKCLH